MNKTVIGLSVLMLAGHAQASDDYGVDATCGLYLNACSSLGNETCKKALKLVQERTLKNALMRTSLFSKNKEVDVITPFRQCWIDEKMNPGTDDFGYKVARWESHLVIGGTARTGQPVIEPGKCVLGAGGASTNGCSYTLLTYQIQSDGVPLASTIHINPETQTVYVTDNETGLTTAIASDDPVVTEAQASPINPIQEHADVVPAPSTSKPSTGASSQTPTSTDQPSTVNTAPEVTEPVGPPITSETQEFAPVVDTVTIPDTVSSAPISNSSAGADFVLPPQFSAVQSDWKSNGNSNPSMRSKKTGVHPDMPSNTTVQRITPDGDFSVYSKRPGYNADGSWIIAGNKIWSAADGSNTGYVPSPSPRNEYSWAYTDREVVYGVGGDGTSFVKRNVVTGQTTVLGSWPEFKFLTVGMFEGTQTTDDRYVVLVGHKDDNTESGDRTHISFDMANRKELGRLKASFNDNHSGFSQNGEFIYVEGNNCCKSDSVYDMRIYDKNFNHLRTVNRKPEHGDWGVDQQGNQVYVMNTGTGINYMIAKTGQVVTALSSGLNWGHLSCRNVARPGYCYYSSSTPGGPIVEVAIAPLDASGNGKVRLYGLPESSGVSSGYNHYPMATPDATGRKVTYHSDGGGGSVYQMQMTLPSS